MSKWKYFYAIPLNKKGIAEIDEGIEHTENMIDGMFDSEEMDRVLNDGTSTTISNLCDTDMCKGEDSIIQPSMIDDVIRVLNNNGHGDGSIIDIFSKAKEVDEPLYLFL